MVLGWVIGYSALKWIWGVWNGDDRHAIALRELSNEYWIDNVMELGMDAPLDLELPTRGMLYGATAHWALSDEYQCEGYGMGGIECEHQ